MRVGELCHLEWPDIDMTKGTIQIRPKDFNGIDKSGKHVKGHWNTKNGEKRAVPMSPKLKEVFAGLPRTSNWVITRPPIDGKTPRQMSDRWLLATLKRTLKKLDMKGHVHTFRHSFVSHALVVGKVPQDVVRQWVGHLDKEIIKQYTHVTQKASHDYMAQMYDEKDTTGQNKQSSTQNTDDAA
jgi:integrase